MLNCYFPSLFLLSTSFHLKHLSAQQHEHNYHKWHRALVYVTRITIQFSPRVESREATEKKAQQTKIDFYSRFILD